MSTDKKWENMNSDEKKQYNDDEDQYNEYLSHKDNTTINMNQQAQLIPDTNNNNNNNNNKIQISKGNQIKIFNNKGIKAFDQTKKTQMLMLKENQIVYLMHDNIANFDKTEDFNTVLSSKNKIASTNEFKKTDDPKIVEKAFAAIFENDKARVSLKYLCAFSLGGKFKKDRKAMNDTIIDLLLAKKIFPYGNDKKCGYNGLLKLAPKLLSSLREKTLPEKKHPWDMNIGEQINFYAAGYESNFEFNSLKLLGCNLAATNFCYTKLLLSIDLLSKKDKPAEEDIKLLKRLASFISGYTVSDYITKKDSTKRVLLLINNMDLKGSDITFDAFGYM